MNYRTLAGGGESIVLLLQQQATMITGAQSSLSGDFDQDQDVDGADFAEWQRGMSPVPESALDLAAWRANYATANSLSAISTVVPEPSALVLQVTVTLVFCITNRRTAVLR